MRSLPTIVATLECETKPLVLPCPAIDLIAIATIADADLRKLKQLVRCDPAIFIFGLANYYDAVGSAPPSFKKFVAWLDTNLLDCFFMQPAGWSKCTASHDRLREQLRPLLKSNIRGGSNRRLRKSLVSFLLATTDIDKPAIKKWIRRLAGKRMAVKRVSVAVGKKKFLNSCLKRWKQKIPRIVDVEAVFRFRHSYELNESEFETRLLEEKLSAMKQLAYGASHEINNPLANISTRAQTLIAGELDPERKRKLAVIYEQALRAHEMISDMMLFANPPRLELVATDVRLLVAKLARELAVELEGNHASGMNVDFSPIELEIRIGPDIGTARLDVTQICVALKALIRNSIDAIRSADRVGKITIRVCRRAGQISFSITDNGIGVSDATKRHLFDPFYSGREAGRGLGFGLSKAWRIARLHGGNLCYDADWSERVISQTGSSDGGPGTRFVLSLPEQEKVIARIGQASVA